MASSSLSSMGGATSGSANCSVRSGKVLGPVRKRAQENAIKKTEQYVKQKKADVIFSHLCHLFVKHQSQLKTKEWTFCPEPTNILSQPPLWGWRNSRVQGFSGPAYASMTDVATKASDVKVSGKRKGAIKWRAEVAGKDKQTR